MTETDGTDLPLDLPLCGGTQPARQRFHALTGLQPGAGSEAPIALPPDI